MHVLLAMNSKHTANVDRDQCGTIPCRNNQFQSGRNPPPSGCIIQHFLLSTIRAFSTPIFKSLNYSREKKSHKPHNAYLVKPNVSLFLKTFHCCLETISNQFQYLRPHYTGTPLYLYGFRILSLVVAFNLSRDYLRMRHDPPKMGCIFH